MSDGMTRREREDLAALVRRREKVAKTAAKQRTAELLADFANKLATIHKSDDAKWKGIVEAARVAVEEADAQIAAICREQGVPEQFRPELRIGWSGRGENAETSRRVELKYLASTRLAAMEKAAMAQIEASSVEIQTQLLAGGLETEAAKAFLESMPTVAALMPPLSVAEIEAAVPIAEDTDSWRYSSRIKAMQKALEAA